MSFGDGLLLGILATALVAGLLSLMIGVSIPQAENKQQEIMCQSIPAQEVTKIQAICYSHWHEKD